MTFVGIACSTICNSSDSGGMSAKGQPCHDAGCGQSRSVSDTTTCRRPLSPVWLRWCHNRGARTLAPYAYAGVRGDLDVQASTQTVNDDMVNAEFVRARKEKVARLDLDCDSLPSRRARPNSARAQSLQ
eukprot:CAMPEP_0115468138 /NCGR_PEP_ID=MMETSP0271-20121206/50797_1 /TAXON_ID=71861 /ORGANISM="Scrippsiella trochoidea, Strain CCMP3099" /LENGTH=128 /DNA_ID=CAMNT_0002895171 /DNA_START=381 /DNA_END=769 /DNA_ORIENTATION=+